MTNLVPTPGMDPVFQLEISTVALGGPGGVMNAQAQALLNRTEYLNNALGDKASIADLSSTTDADKGAGMSGYAPAMPYVHGTTGGRMNEAVSISKFMTSNAMKEDALARTKMIAMDGILMNAWNSGEVIEMLDGDFRVDGDLSSFVVPHFIGKGVHRTRLFMYKVSAGRCFEFLNAPGSFDEGGILRDFSINSFTNHFTGTGAQTAFVLSYTPTADANYSVYVDGVLRTLGVHYTRSGNTITFLAAPASGARIYVPYGSANLFRLNGLVYNNSDVRNLLFRGGGGTLSAEFYDCLTLKPFRMRVQGGAGGLVQYKGNGFVFESPSVESCGGAGIVCDNDGVGISENFGGGITSPHVEECVGNAITVKGKFGFAVSVPGKWVQVSSGPAASAYAAVELDNCQNCSVKGLLSTGGTNTNLAAVKLTGAIKCDIDIETYGFAANKDIVSDAASNRNTITGFREASQGALEKTDASTIKNYYANYAGSGGEYGFEQSYNYFKDLDSAGNVLQDVRLAGCTRPKQPNFLVRLGAAQADVTGDATLYAVPFDVEITDAGGNFSANTFTAPVSGNYRFNFTVEMNQLGSGHTTHEIFIITTGRTFNHIETFGSNPLTTRSITLTTEAPMTAGQTASCSIRVSGSTKTVDVNGGGGMRTYFSGFLVS